MAWELTGRKTLVILLVSFGVVFAVNGYMVSQALSTFRGDDEDQAYLQGANFNQTLARRAEQKALGWQATIGTQRSTDGEVEFVVDIKTRGGVPVQHLHVAAMLRHPTDAHLDRPFMLAERQAGTYAGTLNHVTAGKWHVVVQSGAHDAPFEATRELWLR